MTQYRDNGAIGALMDEYEKAVIELQQLVSTITQSELEEILYPNVELDFISIQTILAHVVSAGYSYVNQIRNHLGENVERKQNEVLPSAMEYSEALTLMISYNEKLFEDYPQITLEEYNSDKKILVTWGQQYDVEQLYEHAIVHILRHRRQIERYLIELR